MTEKEIVENIKKSKKYRAVYIKTIERVVADCINRFGINQVEKEAKNLLHQVWGAFYKTRPNFDKLSVDLKMEKEALLPILKLQSSVAERIPVLDSFYKKIFEVTGIPTSIIDHACGLNPLTLPWMNLKSTDYKAYDIDSQEIDFLNKIGISAKLGDILCDESGYADVVFLLKLLPCLEHQKKNCSLDILRKQKCKYIVVSYPVKSIGGKERGMTEFYRKSFFDLVAGEGWQVTEILFDTELVFVVKK